MSHSRVKVEMIGRRFGRLVVLVECPARNVRGHILYACQCDCGVSKEVLGASLRSGGTTSCGCVHRDAVVKHGLDGTPTHKSWLSMRSRCSDKNSPNYFRYGGRGISVCQRWSEFSNFLDDMGARPKGMSLDRLDTNGNYEPSNCRWADAKTQANNRRNNIRVRIGDRVVGIGEFTLASGLTESGACKRIERWYKKDPDGIFVKESDLPGSVS